MARKQITLEPVTDSQRRTLIRPPGLWPGLQERGDVDCLCPKCGRIVLQGMSESGPRYRPAAVECPECHTVGKFPEFMQSETGALLGDPELGGRVRLAPVDSPPPDANCFERVEGYQGPMVVGHATTKAPSWVCSRFNECHTTFFSAMGPPRDSADAYVRCDKGHWSLAEVSPTLLAGMVAHGVPLGDKGRYGFREPYHPRQS